MNRLPYIRWIALPALLLLWTEATHSGAYAQAASSPKPRRNRPTPAATAPKTTPTPLAAPSPTPSEADEPSPPADKGTNPSVVDNSVVETEIIAHGGDGVESANFNSKERVATFYGEVRVTDPRFQLASDKLTVYLRKSSSNKTTQAAGSSGASSAAATPAALATPTPALNGNAPENAALPDSGGGIDYAIAEGHVVMVQDRPSDTPGGEPKRSMAKAEWGRFDNNTGVMTLKGLPSVEQNGNLHIALSRETVMFLSKEGGLKTKGPSRTLIVQRKGVNDPLGGPTAPAAKPKS